MLHGMGEPIQRALRRPRASGVRVYTPYGAMLPGMAYLVRRLLENTSNESFLKASFTGTRRVDDLLRRSRGGRSHVGPPAHRQTGHAGGPPDALAPFRNEPPTDFTRPEAREAMLAALEEVRGQVRPVLSAHRSTAGKSPSSDDVHVDRPGDSHGTVIGRFPHASARHTPTPPSTLARRAFASWSDDPARRTRRAC